MPPRKPDFDQFLKMLHGERPDRPVLFEHYIDWSHVYPALGPRRVPGDNPPWGWIHNGLMAYADWGYDCMGVGAQWMGFLRFPVPQRDHGSSVGQFTGGIITDEASFGAYPWPDPDRADVRPFLDGVASILPPGMKLLLGAPCGIYDTLVELVGFEGLCLMLADTPDLVERICRELGRRTARIIERCIDHPCLGGVIFCDDWGFKTSTFLRPEDLRQLIFPWHRDVVRITHAAGKVAILHACGCVQEVMDDVIAMGYDAKHSFEDAILPVEEAHARYGSRIAILGGLDVDFLSRSTPDQVYRRSRALLEKTQGIRYALGSGNSITPDVSPETFAAIRAAAST